MEVTYNSKSYPSLNAACKVLKIKAETVKTRMRRHKCDFQKAVDSRAWAQGLEYQGKEYRSVKALCEDLGISRHMVNHRKKAWGITITEAVDSVMTGDNAAQPKRLNGRDPMIKPLTEFEKMMLSGVWSDELPSRLAMITNGRMI